MGRYKRTTNRQEWPELTMAKAINNVVKNDDSVNHTSKLYNISRTSLRRRLDIFNENPDMEMACQKGTSYCLFYFRFFLTFYVC